MAERDRVDIRKTPTASQQGFSRHDLLRWKTPRRREMAGTKRPPGVPGLVGVVAVAILVADGSHGPSESWTVAEWFLVYSAGRVGSTFSWLPGSRDSGPPSGPRPAGLLSPVGCGVARRPWPSGRG